MKTANQFVGRIVILCLFSSLHTSLFSQFYQQYFDGADTVAWSSVFIQIDTSNPANTWQIGPPQKTIFNAAATIPNVLVTDTINTYPINDSSSFSFGIKTNQFWGSIIAYQWMQMLDFDSLTDRGIIEFSVDTGQTWMNAFNNPYVYNFYGYNSLNVDSSQGTAGFTGTDTIWRNVWLCFDISWMQVTTDSLICRFRLDCDSIDNNKEGWMIDNILVNRTIIHTIEQAQKDPAYLKVYPSPSTGRVNIETKKIKDFHIIEHLQVTNSQGRTVREYQNIPTKFFVDLDDLPNGMYYMRIQTNIKTETHPILIQK